MSFHEIKQRVTVETALDLLFSKIKKIGVEQVNIAESLGRVVTSEVRSEVSVPHFNRSAMDGFAVVASDTFGCSQQNPATVELVGEYKVDETPKLRLSSGKTVGVATGSQVPDGADAVVKVENTTRDKRLLKIFFPVTPGENVSKMGEDVRKGEVVVESGQVVRPQDVSILVACGILEIGVAKRPTVGIIATGNELVQPEGKPIPGKVFNVNSYSLSAYVTLYGGQPKDLGVVGDSQTELRNSLESALKYDLAVFSGGTSVGKEDMLPDVVSSAGEMLFRGVSMRPGGPTAVGLVHDKPVFMLPGFPVATMIAFEVFVGPSIRKMMGAKHLDPRNRVTALLASRVPSILGRRDYVRVRLQVNKEGETIAYPLMSGGSGIISSMTKADGLIEVPDDAEGLEKSSRVTVKLFGLR
jgi:molybdenum cofactor synthesis domain-containing protein